LQIIELLSTAWPLLPGATISDEVWPEPDLHRTSFVLIDLDKPICQVSIFEKEINHKDNIYRAFGIGEVVTHPEYKKRGLGTKLMTEAATYIQTCSPDIVLFTCATGLIGFYESAGWQYMKTACIVGGTRENPFRSDELGLVSMMGFYSGFALNHQSDFENADVYLDLSERKLW